MLKIREVAVLDADFDLFESQLSELSLDRDMVLNYLGSGLMFASRTADDGDGGSAVTQFFTDGRWVWSSQVLEDAQAPDAVLPREFLEAVGDWKGVCPSPSNSRVEEITVMFDHKH